MRQLSAAEVHAQKVAELGLDPSARDLTSVEAIAGALRRTASFLCPCTARTLVRGVVSPLRGLVDDLAMTKDLVEDTLDAMIAHGDILEHRDIEGEPGCGAALLLYAAPAGFVVRESGAVLLLGVASDQISAVPDDLDARIEYVNHLRRLTPGPGEDLRSELLQLGLLEILYSGWLRLPPCETCAEHVARLDLLLDAAQPSRDVLGYRSWIQRGALVTTAGGGLSHAPNPGASSLAEAKLTVRISGVTWRCATATRSASSTSRWEGAGGADAMRRGTCKWRSTPQRGEPQRFRIRLAPEGTRALEFFSPVPVWARRRWDAVGEPVSASGCLFAYRLGEAELAEEMRFAREALWLGKVPGSGERP